MKNGFKNLAVLMAAILLATAALSSCNYLENNGGEESVSQSIEQTEKNNESKEEDSKEESASSAGSESVSGSESESDSMPESEIDGTTESESEDVSESEPESETETDGEPESTSESIDESTSESETASETTKPAESETEDTRFEKEYAPVVYMNPTFIQKATKNFEWGEGGSNMLGGYLSDDKSYVKLIPFDGERESLFYLVESYTNIAPVIAVKYRTRHSGFYMEFFMDSKNERAQSGSSFSMRGLRCDGEWDVKIVDIREKLYEDIFNGSTVNYIRFDFANGDPIPPECEIDIEYVAFFNSVEDAQHFEYGEDYVAPDSGVEGDDKATLFFDSIDIDSAAAENTSKNLSDASLSDDMTYVTLRPKVGNTPDGYINLLLTKRKAARYMAIKYRTEDLGYWIEVFADSVNKSATSGSNFTFYPINDGEWHVFVIDLVDKLGETKFNGQTVNYIRFDFMNINGDQSFEDWALDIEYIAFYENEIDAKGKDYDPNAPVNIFDAEEIKTAVDNKNTSVGSANLSDDGKFVTIEAAEGAVNAYAYLFTSKREAARYMVVKYRTNQTGFYMQLWTNSGAYTAGAAKITVESFPRDGKWQYGVYDLYTALPEKQFNDQYLSHFRFDFIHRNGDLPAPVGVTLDVGFIAFFDSMEAAEAYVEADRPVEEDKDPDIDDPTPDEDQGKAYFDAEDIADAANKSGNKNVGGVLISENSQFVTLVAKQGGKDDAYIKLLTTPKNAGAYFAIKYRTQNSGFWTEFFMDSINSEATGGSNFNFSPVADGEWHIFVIDVTEKLGSSKFDGETVNYIRFDFINQTTLGNWSIDVAGIGFYDSEEEALTALSGEITDSPTVTEDDSPVFVMDAEYIANKLSDGATNIESYSVSEDVSYVTVNPTDSAKEAYDYLFTTDTVVGRYMVLKYRTESAGFYMELYMNSNSHSAGSGKINVEGISASSEWKTVIVDLGEKLGGNFDGSKLGHFRFDFFNGSTINGNTYVDVAYVAFFNTSAAAEAYSAN